MTAASFEAQRPSGSSSRIVAAVASSSWLLPVLACIGVLLARWRSPANYDVSALITWAERLLDGGRPFVDFVEVNPPGSILLYVPAVAIARVTGLSPELMSDLLVCAIMALSLAMCWRILTLARLLEGHDATHLLAAAIAIIGAIPAVDFGQREHIGLIAALPVVAVAAAEAHAVMASRTMRLLAGLLAGLSMIAKPHFALVYAAITVFGMVTTRRFTLPFRLQWITAAATLAAYVATTWWAYPEFYAIALPKIADVYLGWRNDMITMLSNPVPVIAAVAYVALRRQHMARRLAPGTMLLAAAAAGAGAMYLIQGRGWWPYHALPAILLTALAIAWEATRRPDAGAPAVPALLIANRFTLSLQHQLLAALAIVALTAFVWNSKYPTRDLDSIVATVKAAHPHPRMLAISDDISVGHPLVRRVQGTWSHRVTHLWTAHGVYIQLGRDGVPPGPRRDRLLAHLKAEIDDLAASIEREKPDIIVAQRSPPGSNDMDWLEWANRFPGLARQLTAYSSVMRIDDVEILKRTTIAAAPHKANAAPLNSRAP